MATNYSWDISQIPNLVQVDDVSDWDEKEIARLEHEAKNLLKEIGVDDYYCDTKYSFKIRSIDQAKLKPITRPLSFTEQQIIDGIYELHGVRVPVLSPS